MTDDERSMNNKKSSKSLGKLVYVEPDKILHGREKKIKSLSIFVISNFIIVSIFIIYILIIFMTLLFIILTILFFISTCLMLFIWFNSLDIAKTARLKIFENGFILSIKPKEIKVFFSEIIFWKYDKFMEYFKIKLENETIRIHLDNIEIRNKFHDVLSSNVKLANR